MDHSFIFITQIMDHSFIYDPITDHKKKLYYSAYTVKLLSIFCFYIYYIFSNLYFH